LRNLFRSNDVRVEKGRAKIGSRRAWRSRQLRKKEVNCRDSRSSRGTLLSLGEVEVDGLNVGSLARVTPLRNHRMRVHHTDGKAVQKNLERGRACPDGRVERFSKKLLDGSPRGLGGGASMWRGAGIRTMPSDTWKKKTLRRGVVLGTKVPIVG